MSKVFLGLLLALLTQSVFADDALYWLKRMDDAGDRLNYQGTLVYSYGDILTSFKLTHVRDGSREWEHLVQLDGRANEVVRGGGDLIYKAPGGTSTHLRIQPSASLRPDATAESLARIAAQYHLTATAGERIAGRDALRVAVMPNVADRYGHVFYLDKASGLLLKSQLLDTDGDVLETLGFSSFAVGDKVGLQDYQNARHAAAEAQSRRPAPPPHVPAKPLPARWQFWTPAGFSAGPEGVRAKRMNGSRVEVITLSDGLSSVSVFSEPVTGKAPRTGQSTRGSTALVSRVVGEGGNRWLLTVVGEVPLETARHIADSVVPAAK